MPFPAPSGVVLTLDPLPIRPYPPTPLVNRRPCALVGGPVALAYPSVPLQSLGLLLSVLAIGWVMFIIHHVASYSAILPNDLSGSR
jgi:hypothetical protein